MTKKKTDRVALVRNVIIAGVALVILAVIGYGLLYSSGATQGEFVAGKDYRVLEDAPRRRPGSPILVQEFFSYGCVHCRNFDPLVTEWLARLPEDVRFERIPVAFSPAWMLLAQTYYAMDELGILEQNHSRLFAHIHDRRQMFANASEIADFIDGNGATAAEFLEALNSPEVRRRMRDAVITERRVGITAVPTLVVDGRYVVTMDVGRKVALEVVDHLIRMERAGDTAADAQPTES
ncbi:MAG: thiol:disulfide interchange protein DsbA/DsbL [Pseudomonadales bacterium]|jgi:thiol:disulfide interchange protein DsbA